MMTPGMSGEAKLPGEKEDGADLVLQEDLERKNMSHKPIPGGMPPKKPRKPDREIRWLIPVLAWASIIIALTLMWVLLAGHVI